jgi:large subunit ribosomal protein L17
MKHGVSFRKLRRTSAHRWAMLRTMVSQLVEHGRIETTLAKAKELRRVADQVVTLGKEGTLAARRRAAAVVRGDDPLRRLFGEMAARYAAREGGYCRILRTRRRPNDAAQMAFVEYVDRPGELRPARPARAGAGALLPPAARAALEAGEGGA